MKSTCDTMDETRRLEPSALPAALRGRLLRAMQGAAQEEAEDAALEARLRCLQPAPLTDKQGQRCLNTVFRSSAEYAYAASRRSRRYVYASVASLALLLGLAPLLFSTLSGRDSSAQGLASRMVLQQDAAKAVRWSADGAPVQEYSVLYEDSFVLEDADNSTIVVRVPNRTNVSVPMELI